MSFVHYLQHDYMDCGPSCLKMIAKYYGKTYTLETLRRKCFVTREGVSLLGISDGAESIGLHSIGVKLSLKQLCEEAPLPCILHWNQFHFVVLYKINKGKKGLEFFIADPASQKLTYQKDEFVKCWITKTRRNENVGTALLLEPSPEFDTSEDEKIDSARNLMFFAKYLYPYKSQFIQLIIGMIIGTGLQMIFPFLTQSLVDVGIQSSNLSFIVIILIAQLTLFVSQVSVDFIRSWILLHVNSRVDISLISDFFVKLMKLPIRYFDTKMTGDIMQRIDDHGRIKSFLMNNSVSIIFSICNFVFFSIILGYYNLSILGIFTVGNMLYSLWIMFFLRYRRELDIKRFNQSAGEQSKIIQLIQGMQEIKLNNCEKMKRWEWERIQARLYKISIKGLKIGQIQQVGSIFFSQTTNIIISYIAATNVVNGSMTLGMMMSLTYIVGQVSAPIMEFIGFAQSFQDAKISLERLNEIHSMEDEDHGIENKLTELPLRKDIYLNHVSFSYSGSTRDYALKDINLVIPEHKVTAFVGASGSGKTTLIKLLQGFYKQNEGIIKVGETSLDNINPHTWRSKTGSVMQESYIFSDTIANNIAISTEHVNLQKLLHAADVANITDFIESLPLGFETKIGMEGNGISQGQRQRILIARAVYKMPEYIFLDEATNSLDANNESIIMKNLEQFYKGKTVIVAAHRLSTVKNADNIVVLDKGEIIEQGTHNELVSLRGAYHNLVKNQLELGD